MMSVIVLHPLKIMRAEHSRLNSEIRFVISAGQTDLSPFIERSLLFVSSRFLSEFYAFFATVDDERIVFSQRCPGSARHFAEFHESPIGDVRFFQPEIIAHSRGDIEACAPV